MGHTLRHGGLLRDILEGEVGKKRGRGRPRLKYFDQIIRDMGCETFREVKQLEDGWLRQTSLRTGYSMMMKYFNIIIVQLIKTLGIITKCFIENNYLLRPVLKGTFDSNSTNSLEMRESNVRK